VTTVAILQPGFLPWLGFFDQMHRADHFVYYDDVQFDKHGWRNRNRIKTANGVAWVTVPVRHGGLHGQSILDTEIDHSKNWARKMLASIKQSYARSPHCQSYIEELTHAWCDDPPARLLDLDMRTTELMRKWLGIATPVLRSSELGIQGGQTDRLVAICKHLKADTYLSGNAAKDYLQQDLFDAAGISVVWQNYEHPIYPQLHGEFVPFLSAIDLILNLGPESGSVIRGQS
jgi:hypothetical protein